MKTPREASRFLSVGQLSARSGVAISAIRFYEDKGLIGAMRSAGNQRRYAPSTLRRLAVIRAAQRTGLSLEDIAGVLARYPEGATLTAAQWRALSSSWRVMLDERIRMLTRLRDELDGCIGCGCLSQADCPLRNPDDVLGKKKGAGAHILNRP